MQPASARFLNACNEQGVAVNAYTQSYLDTSRPDVIKLFTEALHDDLREWDHKITDGILDIEQLPDDGMIRTLGVLANIGHGQEDTRSAAAEIPAPATANDGTCSKIEQTWARTIQAPAAGKLALVQLFVDQGKPIVARKGRGAYPSAVLLQPVAAQLNGKRIVYPEGAIVSVNAKGDDGRIDRSGKYSKLRNLEGTGGCAISPLEDLEGLSFLRFSPLAYPIKERTQFFRDGIEVEELAEIPDAMGALHGLADHLYAANTSNHKNGIIES